MNINSIQSYNNYNNRISNRMAYTGNKCSATNIADSVAFKGKDAYEALKIYLVDRDFVNKNKVDKLTRESSLQYDVGLDSINFLELQMDLEDAIGKEIPDEDFYKILTLNDVINFMTSHSEDFSSDKKALLKTRHPGYYELLCF